MREKREEGELRTLITMRGHPKALVLWNAMSMGKFQTIVWSLPPALREICEMPFSTPYTRENNNIQLLIHKRER